jgi:hypothetical protein
LLADLNEHHPNVAKTVIGSEIVEVRQATGEQLLAKAKEFYAE